jgi:hypothetical protein
MMSGFGGSVGEYVSLLRGDDHGDHHQKPGGKDGHADHHFQQGDPFFSLGEQTLYDFSYLGQHLVSFQLIPKDFSLSQNGKKSAVADRKVYQLR